MSNLENYTCMNDYRDKLYMEVDNDSDDVSFSIEGYGFNGFQSSSVTLDYDQIKELHSKLTEFLEVNK